MVRVNNHINRLFRGERFDQRAVQPPGIDHGLVPARAEAEWVSVDGDVVEAAFWCGPLAEVPRRATLLPSSRAGTWAGQHAAPPR